jgi:gliding motility-associated-like protein
MYVNPAKTLILIAAGICCLNIAMAQSFTTKGVEFWTAYGAHSSMYNANGDLFANGGNQKMVFYFLSNKATTVTVDIPAIGWVKTYKVTAGKTTESDEMPKAGTEDIRLLNEGVSNKSIHITSDDQITAYCHIYDDKSSATTLLIPVNLSGQEYYTLGYTQESADPNGRSYCLVIATDDSTEIEVTPSANILNHPAGVPFSQMLNKGEVLSLFGIGTGSKDGIYTGTDLSGTYISTVVKQDSEICKKIVVFSGSTATSVLCKETSGGSAGTISSDPIFEQVPCIDNWGRMFIAVPTLNMETNRYRAIVVDSKQKVWLNGRLLTNLINNRYYEFKSNTASTIRSDSLIAVAQYITNAGQCGNETAGEEVGDPEMIFLSPANNGVNTTFINSTRHSGIDSHFINVVMKASDIDSFKLDGYTMPEVFKVYDRNSTYAIAQIQVSAGRHVLECDSGFNTYAYGYGKLESYGYNGGFSTRHIDAYLGVRNPYKSTFSIKTTCTLTPFRMYFDVDVRLLSLYCNFNNNSNLFPNKELWLTNIHPDSSYFVDSINTTFYRYYLPDIYQNSMIEQMPVEIETYYPDRKGCIVKNQFDFLVDVIQKPLARISAKYDSCINGALYFIDSSLSFGNSKLVEWQWNFSDGRTSNEENPQLQNNNYGVYSMQMRTINDVGCYADTVKTIGMYHRPVASFIVSGDSCNKQDMLFKSTASVQGDELAEWQWNFSDKTTTFSQSLIKQFADSGNYEIKLVAKTKHGCADTAIQLVHIYKTPEISVPPIFYVPEGDTLQINPSYIGNIKNYNWMPATYLSSTTIPSPMVSARTDMTYSITASAADAPCKANATTTIKIQKKLYIPSAFTPNGDGRNDTWRITNLEGYPNCTVEVYNRWGNRVFYSKGYPAPWNGTMNNQQLPNGTYLYVIQAHSRKNNIIETGSVTIIR